MTSKKNFLSTFLKCIKTFSIVLTISLLTAPASKAFFTSSQYYLPIGKCMMMSPGRRVERNIDWESSNPGVATIDSNGVIYSQSMGTTEIRAYRHGTCSKCVLNVVEEEPIRSVYTNIPKENEDLIVYAVTPQDIKGVRLIVNGPNYYKEVYPTSKSSWNGLYIWQQNLGRVGYGTYKLTAYGNMNGSFRSCCNSEINFSISQNSSRASDVSTSRKTLSRDGTNFIVRQEGFSSRAYVDLASYLTIGCGKVIYPYTSFYDKCSRSEAYQWLLSYTDQSGTISALNDLLAGNGIKFNQHQFDALISFSYNLGKGWMGGSSLRSVILNSGGSGETTGAGTVTERQGIYLRSGPGTSHRRIASLFYGTRLTLLNPNKENGNWYHVRTSSGREGYCCSDYVSLERSGGGDRSLNSINRSEFINEFIQYHHVGRKCIRGLLRRRLEELEIFFENNYDSHSPFSKYPTPACMRR